MVKNLTEGKPLNLLFFFALPMVAGNLFQQLYNMVDTAVVGKFVGEDAVAAVGSSFPIVFLSVAVASGLSMGCNVVVSQLFGARRIHEMKTTISTAIISMSVLGLIIMALGTVFAGPLLQLLEHGGQADLGDALYRRHVEQGDLHVGPLRLTGQLFVPDHRKCHAIQKRRGRGRWLKI